MKKMGLPSNSEDSRPPASSSEDSEDAQEQEQQIEADADDFADNLSNRRMILLIHRIYRYAKKGMRHLMRGKRENNRVLRLMHKWELHQSAPRELQAAARRAAFALMRRGMGHAHRSLRCLTRARRVLMHVERLQARLRLLADRAHLPPDHHFRAFM